MTAQTSKRLPWLFFVGPDGVVRTAHDANQAATLAALERHGLADRLVR